MYTGCVSLVAAPITFWRPFTLSSQGEAGVAEGQKAIPTLVEVTVSQSGTNEVHFSKTDHVSGLYNLLQCHKKSSQQRAETHQWFNHPPPDPYTPERMAQTQLHRASLER